MTTLSTGLKEPLNFLAYCRCLKFISEICRKIGDGSQFSDMPVPLFCRDRLGMAISVFIPTPQRYIFFHVSQKISCKKRIIENRPRFSLMSVVCAVAETTPINIIIIVFICFIVFTFYVKENKRY